MSELFSEDLYALQKQKFASPLERYSAWKRLVEDPRAGSATSEEQYTLYAEAASALNASPALQEPDGLAQLVKLTRTALELAPREGSAHGLAAIDLSRVLASRAAQTHEPSDVEACHEHARVMLHVVPKQDWRYPLYVLAEATVYYELAILSDDGEYADHAISSLRATRSMVRPGSGIFGTTTAYLANICLQRHIKTGEFGLLEEAIACGYEFAATERQRRDERTLALISLSGALRRRYQLNGDTNDIAYAAASADEALESVETVAEQFRAHSARGTAYRQLFERTNNVSALDKALDSNLRAIDLYPEDGGRDSHTVAVLLDNYANGLASRYRMFKNTADLQTSAETCRRALGLLPADDPDRGRILKNLGVTLLQLARDTGDSHALIEADSTLREALAHVGPDEDEKARAHAILADVCLELAARSPTLDRAHALERALEEFDAARKILDRPSMRPTEYELGRRGIVASIAEKQIGALLCLSKLVAPGEGARWLKLALVAGETAKARLLAHELMRINTAPPPEVHESLAEEEQLLLANLARLGAQELRHRGNELADPLHIARMQRRAQIYLALQDIWSQMASISPAAADYVAMRRGRPHDWVDTLATQLAGRVCIAVMPFQDPPCACESITGAGVPATGGVTTRRRLAIMAIGATLSEPAVAVSPGENPIPGAIESFVKQVPIEAEWARRSETWHTALVSLLADLAAIAGPVDELLISPSREGFALPWHVAVTRAGWKTPQGSPLGVTTVPTLELVGAAHNPANPTTRWHIAADARELGVDDPEGIAEGISYATRVPVVAADGPPIVIGDPLGDLPGARREAEAVARVLGVQPLINGDARSQTVFAALSKARVIHLATHARLNADEPLNSLIYLADKNVMVRDLLGLRSAAELIVLSACKSGLGGNLRGEEILGLAYTLLCCGTREVIASLWRVDDEATEALMSNFYEHRPTVGSPAALAAAMSSIRSIPKWSDPYYWAGFILLATGDTARM